MASYNPTLRGIRYINVDFYEAVCPLGYRAPNFYLGRALMGFGKAKALGICVAGETWDDIEGEEDYVINQIKGAGGRAYVWEKDVFRDLVKLGTFSSTATFKFSTK